MTVMRRILSKMGVVGIKVDTVLEKDEIVAGEEIKGVVKIKGTSMKQTIDGVHLTLSIKFERNLRKRNIHTRYDLHRVKITDKFTLLANESKEIPFEFVVPNDTPITLDDELIWIHTNLNIKNAIDPVDDDYITILPSSKMKNIIQEIENVGFTIHKFELNESPKQYKIRFPFVQEVLLISSEDSLKNTTLRLIPLINEEFSIEIIQNNVLAKSIHISNYEDIDLKGSIMDILKEK